MPHPASAVEPGGPGTPGRRDANPDGDRDEAAGRLWAATRSGARAGRGFHFQDVVGAWLCARLLSGELLADRVVPEGYEDLSCEGMNGWEVQVKSRQERVGDFSSADVAEHLLALAVQHKRRSAAGLTGRPVLVVERPIGGMVLSQWGVAIGDQSAATPLVDALLALAERHGVSEAEIRGFTREVCVFVLPWRVAAEESRDAIAARFDLMPAAADPVVLALRDDVAAAADANASLAGESRAAIDVTRAQLIATDVVRMLDVSALEEAVRRGTCEPIDLDTRLFGGGFYEGVNVQPGHIAAGLPAPRPTLTGQVIAALGTGGRVVLSGPSGVGKSTVMWAAAYSTRSTLWYRVRRLHEADVNSIVNLARASRPTSRSPVGLVVDGIGSGSMQAWDALVQALAGIPNVLLLGSVRTEDMLELRTLTDCISIEVGLDEEVAARIHTELVKVGATNAAHWREAFDAAQGLTLEFTHLLTSGRRLEEVISEQIRRRVSDGRDVELNLIGYVATAHRWSADLDLRAVQQRLGLTSADIRRALARLAREHLVDVQGTRLVGLHQLRSIALSDAVHRMPPPSLAETVRDVLHMLDDSQLRPFLVGVLRDEPDLAPDLLSGLGVELERRGSPLAFASATDALRIADFQATAHEWKRTLDLQGVAPAYRAVTIQLSLLGTEDEMPWRPEIAAALPAMAAETSTLRATLLQAMGDERVGRLLSGATDSATAIAALSPLRGTEPGSALVEEMRRTDSTLAGCLREASADELGEVLATAREVSTGLAAALLEAAGGAEPVLALVREAFPQVTELGVRDREGSPVAYARLMHVSDRQNSDPDGTARHVARMSHPGVSGGLVCGVSPLVRGVRCESSRPVRPRSGSGRRSMSGSARC